MTASEVQLLTPATRAFALREELRKWTLASQEMEHDFYKGLSTKVKETTQLLAEKCSEIMQVEMMQWSPTQILSFVTITEITADEIDEWRAICSRALQTYDLLSGVNERKTQAITERAKFAGIFGTPKSGSKINHALADLKVNELEAEAKLLNLELRTVREDIEKTGKTLLEKLMGQATSIASSHQFGAGLKGIIERISQDTEEVVRAHSEQQRLSIEKMQNKLGELKAIYGA